MNDRTWMNAVVVALALGLPLAASAERQDAVDVSSAEVAPRSGEPAGESAVAIFAGGCFWCMEPPFDALDGVISTTSGYAGGHKADPSYEEVSAGGTGHREVIRIVYDPKRVSYETLLDVFWHNIDPLDPRGQFCDKGDQYRSAIYVQDETQERQANASLARLVAEGGLPGLIVTDIVQASTFYPAEDYHQDYYEKRPYRYKFYRYGCGRDKRLDELWGDRARVGARAAAQSSTESGAAGPKPQ